MGWSLSVAVGASDKIDMCYDTVDDAGFIEPETLILPEVGVNNAFTDRFFEDGGRVEAIGSEGSRGTTLVKESFFVGTMVRHLLSLVKRFDDVMILRIY